MSWISVGDSGECARCRGGRVAGTKIEPHKITKPFQLLAVWFAGLVLLVGFFLGAAVKVTNPSWLSALFGIAAVGMVPLFLIMVFLMQTKFRPQLQDDPYYADYLQRLDAKFKDFQPENIKPPGSAGAVPETGQETWKQREERRISRYQQNQGLFLVHTWRPSRTPGQVADIAISLHQHDEGPLSKGKVKSVEYHLGPRFFDHPVIKTNAKQNFRLDVSAYGPMLCLARVNFTDGKSPLELERYINF